MENSGTATIRNSTFSGNSAPAGFGGAIINFGTLDLLHVTVTGNTSGAGGGGGVASFGSVSIFSSIVAGNTSSDGSQFYLGAGSTVEDFNFISSGDPKLGPLQDNGGPTFTRLPLAGSPALDGADNTLAALAGLTTDQRGFARVMDGPDNDTDQTADIGAVEAHPSIEDIPALTIGEDTTLSFAFGLGDESAGFDSITVTSSNQALVADGNIFITGSGATRTLEANPEPNTFGTATITITIDKTIAGTLQTASDTFLLTVLPVADTPSVTSATTFAEVQTTSGLVIERAAADGAEVTHFQITSITAGTLFQNNGTTPIVNGDFITYAQGNAGLRFTPDAGATTLGSFFVQASTAANIAGLGGAVVPALITSTRDGDVVTAHDPNPSVRAQRQRDFTVVSTTGGPTPTGVVTVSAGPGEECAADVSVGGCALPLTTPGVDRTLTATYAGDAVSLDSVGTALHTVTACTGSALTVTSTDDDGPGTLREALANICPGGNIAFDLAGPGPHTINVTTGALFVDRDVTIAALPMSASSSMAYQRSDVRVLRHDGADHGRRLPTASASPRRGALQPGHRSIYTSTFTGTSR